MSGPSTLSLTEAGALASAAFLRAGVSESPARSTARALVAAEADGQKGHGLTRVATYVEQVRTGKVRGDAAPSLTRPSPAAILVDAGHGFAYPAIDAALAALVPLTNEMGVGIAGIRRSHHFGQAGQHVERLADAGLIGILFGNSPKAMAFFGGARPMVGTNPIAFAAPLETGPPLVIDLALSIAARGKVVAAAKAGEAIPGDWAIGPDGQPTTDAALALKGSMAPLGGAKGAGLALMVEILAAAVTGANFGWEASSFLDGEGPPPNVGQIFLAIDPLRISGGAYPSRMAFLLSAMAEEAGVRLPGATRLANRAHAVRDGLALSPALVHELRVLAGDAP